MSESVTLPPRCGGDCVPSTIDAARVGGLDPWHLLELNVIIIIIIIIENHCICTVVGDPLGVFSTRMARTTGSGQLFKLPLPPRFLMDASDGKYKKLENKEITLLWLLLARSIPFLSFIQLRISYKASKS